jgi:hypothetical protein
MMKAIILSLGLMFSLLCSNEQQHRHLTYDLSLSLLQTIHKDAIVYGYGRKIVYVFVDPLCPHSRKFLNMISKNPLMIEKYQYHIFLYSIPRMKSTDVVSAIYMSKNPVETLLRIMIDDEIDHSNGNTVTRAKVHRIERVAKEMDVYKRPYIFIVVG